MGQTYQHGVEQRFFMLFPHRYHPRIHFPVANICGWGREHSTPGSHVHSTSPLLWSIKQMATKEHFIRVSPQQSPAAINFLQTRSGKGEWEWGKIGQLTSGWQEGCAVASPLGLLSSGVAVSQTTALLHHKGGEL